MSDTTDPSMPEWEALDGDEPPTPPPEPFSPLPFGGPCHVLVQLPYAILNRDIGHPNPRHTARAIMILHTILHILLQFEGEAFKL